MEKRELTCIVCPLGCHITVTLDKGKVIDVRGYSCPKGKEYAYQEIVQPVRTLATTVKIHNGTRNMLPVKTSKPIPKELLLKAMDVIAKVEVDAPIKIGTVIIKNILNTGADVIATATVEKKE